ncbi:MAG: hypothetical protein DRJ01_15125 [Bacteroidetes bacterium]|nr:MAG: hypothetical protein DRJ01_15125 [Bacteroidota bacterium]
MKRLFLLILMMYFSSIINAEKSTISLEESIKLAKKNNKEILAEKSSLTSANWMQKNALTNFFPKTSFNSTTIRIDNDTFDKASKVTEIPVFGPTGAPTGDYIPFSATAMSNGFYKTTYMNNITVQQPIFNGGKVILGYQLAKLAKEQAVYSLQNKENDISFQVASTYFNILKLQELKKLSEKSLESTESHLKMVQDKFQSGMAKKSDILQWQVKLQNDRTSLNEIENNLNILLSLWGNILGIEGDVPIPIRVDVKNYNNEIDEINSQQSDNSLKEFLSKVKAENSNIRIMDLTQKMLKKSYLIAKGNFLPSLNLQFTYEIEKDNKLDFSGDDNWNLVAAFSFPLFSSGANYTNLQKAKYDLRKVKYSTKSVKENILIGAKSSYLNMNTKAETIRNNKIALSFAEENSKIINDLFEQGMVTNSELLDAEVMIFASKMNLVTSYYDFILTKYNLKKYTQ